MKKQIISLLSLASAMMLLFSSCDKTDNTPPPKSKSELLAQGTWKFKLATANGTDISNQNPPFEPCKKDNILSFTIAGAGTVNEGATKCNVSDPDNIPFTWNFANNETTLHISTTLFSGGSNDFTLEAISESEMTISQGYTPIAGPTYLIKITFQH